MSSDGHGRSAAASSATHAEAPAEVLEFIRYCYRRRGYGWPELYDEMCAVAARGSYRDMDYEGLARLGIGFSLCEMPRLIALSQLVVAEERAARQGEASPVDSRKGEARREEVRPTTLIAATLG